jgi:hypothetical protein
MENGVLKVVYPSYREYINDSFKKTYSDDADE